MARRKNDAPLTDFDFNAVEVQDAPELPKIANRDEKPNPLVPALRESLDTGKAKVLPRIPEAARKDADNYLRRAAIKLGCGVAIRPVDNGDGTVALHFQAKAKSKRNYTIADVREWARENGYAETDLTPKVQHHVSDAYRAAHDLPAVKR